MRQERDSVTWGEVLTSLLVVLLIESAQEFLEHRSHVHIVERWEWQAVRVILWLIGEVDAWVGDTFDDGKQTVVVGKFASLVIIVEVIQYILHVVAVAAHVFNEVLIEDVVVVGSLVLQTVQCPLGGVIVRELGNVAHYVLIYLVFGVHFFQLFLHLFLGWFKEGIQSAEHHHRQNDITILTTQEDIT